MVLIVTEDESGMRLDRFLAARLPELGRAGARYLVDRGFLRLSRGHVSPGTRLLAGQRIELAPEAPTSMAATPDPSAALDIVYEDAALVVVDKPGGQPCHPLRPAELGTLASGLLHRFPEMRGVGHSPREPGLVHRLDGGTSGLVLCARSRGIFERLRAALTGGEIDKRYLALCAGTATPTVARGSLLARGRRVVVRGEPIAGARAVTTELLAVEPVGRYSLVEIRVSTAARHQVRAHLAYLGHPIIGDELYGGPPHPELRRHFLHASELRFTHPQTGRPVHTKAPLPEDLLRAIAARD